MHYHENERRRDAYAFESEKDLRAFFSNSLPKQIINNTLKQIKNEFILRTGSTPAEKKLQYLKKCEAELVRMMRTNSGGEMPGTKSRDNGSAKRD